MKSLTGHLKLFLLRAWLPVALVATWWFASEGSTSLYFPPLRSILEVFVQDWMGPMFATDLLPSLAKFGIGFALAGVLGILLGLVLGLSPALRAATDPIIQFLRSLPPPVLLPFCLLVFGIGGTMSVAIIVLGAIWPTLLNTTDGVRSVDTQLDDFARSYRLTAWQRIGHVVLPSAMPQIFAGLRTTLQMSIILIVVSEMVASVNGIGFQVLVAQQTFAVPETWAGTFVLGLIGYGVTLIFVRIEKTVLRWQTGLRLSTGGA